MKKSSWLSFFAALVFAGGVFVAPLFADDTMDLLTSNPWKFSGMDVSAVRIFNKDGTFTTNGDAAATGKWQAAGGNIELIFKDGHKETLSLPLNAKGTPGADGQGNAIIASQQKLAVVNATAAQPEATPSPAATSSGVVAAGDANVKMLLAGPWKMVGISWSSTRVFYENGLFNSPSNAKDNGKWKLRPGGVDLSFDNNGNVDTFTLPLDPKGTLGVDAKGFPLIAYLQGAAPASLQGTANSPAPALVNISPDDTTNLLVSGPWKMWGVDWSVQRTFRRDGTFFSEDNKASGRGKWKISGKIIELLFEDGHSDLLEMPLNVAGTRGVGSDNLGYVACLMGTKESTPAVPLIVPATPREAEIIKLLTFGPWFIRTGVSGGHLRTYATDGTYTEYRTNVDPVKAPNLVLHGRWRIDGDTIETFRPGAEEGARDVLNLPLNARGTFGEDDRHVAVLAYLPSAVIAKDGQAPVAGPLVPQKPGVPSPGTIPVWQTEAVLMGNSWEVMGVNWSAGFILVNKNHTMTPTMSYPNGKSLNTTGSWSINGGVLLIAFNGGPRCTFSLPLNWKQSPGIASDGYAVMLHAASEPRGLVKPGPKPSAAASSTPAGAPPADTAANFADVVTLLASGTWEVSGANWTATRVFSPNGTFTTVEKGNGELVSERVSTATGTWKIADGAIELSADGHVETMKLPLDPKGTVGVDTKRGATLSRLQTGKPQPASPTPAPQALSRLNVAPPPSKAVPDKPPVRSMPSVPPPKLFPNTAVSPPLLSHADSGKIEERIPVSSISAGGQQRAADFLKAHHDGLVIVKGKETQGSAFIAAVDGSNCLLTNTHVFSRIPDGVLQTLDGGELKPAETKVAADRDLCSVAMPAGGTPLEISLDVAKDAAIGDEVAVFGNAGGESVVKIVTGKITGIAPDRVQVNAPFGPSLSGSPIVDLNSGKVIAVATYDFFQDDVPPSGITNGVPIDARCFGARFDSAKTWEPVNPATFAAQAAELRAMEALTGDLYDMCETFSKGYVRIDPATIGSAPVRNAVQRWVEANSTTKPGMQVQRDSAVELFGALKDAAGLGITLARQHMTYGYFKMEVAREQEYRDALAKWFDQSSQRLRGQNQKN